MTKSEIYRTVRMNKADEINDWDCRSLLTKDFQVPRVFHQPTRDEIYQKIVCLTNYNHETFECNWFYRYYDKTTGIRAEHKVRMNVLEYKKALLDEEARENLNRHLGSIIETLIDQVFNEYNKRYYAEVFNMTNQQFDNFHRTLQSLGGEIFLEANSIDQKPMDMDRRSSGGQEGGDLQRPGRQGHLRRWYVYQGCVL